MRKLATPQKNMRYNILFKGYVELKYTQDKTLIQFHLSTKK